MENYKDNIIATRVGSLGSSDAKMVAKIGRVGKLAYADKERLAVLTGQKEQHDFSNAATRNRGGKHSEVPTASSLPPEAWYLQGRCSSSTQVPCGLSRAARPTWPQVSLSEPWAPDRREKGGPQSQSGLNSCF